MAQCGGAGNIGRVLAVLPESGDGWREDRTPEVDPIGDQAFIEPNRARVLAAADIVIPGHGGPFRVKR